MWRREYVRALALPGTLFFIREKIKEPNNKSTNNACALNTFNTETLIPQELSISRTLVSAGKFSSKVDVNSSWE